MVSDPALSLLCELEVPFFLVDPDSGIVQWTSPSLVDFPVDRGARIPEAQYPGLLHAAAACHADGRPRNTPSPPARLCALGGSVVVMLSARPETSPDAGDIASFFAHELKNPLAAVIGALSILTGRFDSGSADRSIMEASRMRLLALSASIDELVFFARPIVVQSHSVDISDVLHRAHKDLQLSFPELELQVEGAAPEARGDARLLRHCFRNLLSNAGAAMRGPGGVRARVAPRPSGAEVSFEDEGPGVPRELEAEIFKPFFSTRAGGAGLGLPVAARIARAHGGELSLSASPKGARFVVLW